MTYPEEATAILIGQYEGYGHSAIGTLLMSVGLGTYDPGSESADGRGINREKRLTTAIQKAPSEIREKALRKLTVKLCNECADLGRPGWVDELIEELRSGAFRCMLIPVKRSNTSGRNLRRATRGGWVLWGPTKSL